MFHGKRKQATMPTMKELEQLDYPCPNGLEGMGWDMTINELKMIGEREVYEFRSFHPEPMVARHFVSLMSQPQGAAPDDYTFNFPCPVGLEGTRWNKSVQDMKRAAQQEDDSFVFLCLEPAVARYLLSISGVARKTKEGDFEPAYVRFPD
jgi:hypothetical protein